MNSELNLFILFKAASNRLLVIKFTAVKVVQPPERNTFAISNSLLSNITPAPAPTTAFPIVKVVKICIVGITFSLAGIATIYANRLTPFHPINIPKGSNLLITQIAMF